MAPKQGGDVQGGWLPLFIKGVGALVTLAAVFGACWLIVDAVYQGRLQALEVRLETEIDQLEQRIASIERGIGDNEQVLDLRDKVISPSAISNLSNNVSYHEDDKFVALHDTDVWEYGRKTGYEFAKFLLGADHALVKEQEPIGRKIHIWRSPEYFAITSIKGLANIVHYISVEPIELQVIRDTIPEEKHDHYSNFGDTFRERISSHLFTEFVKMG